MRSMSARPLFELEKQSSSGLARAGYLKLGKDGSLRVPTPIFMPVGTRATVKGLWHHDLEEMGYDLILGNTYHLYLKPGPEILAKAGGLGPFQDWHGALLTDSGGYQVFSLSQRTKFQKEGVEFASHIDGSKHLFTPQSVIDAQTAFGSDIMMVLDDCPPADADQERREQSLERTHRWAEEAVNYFYNKCDDGSIDPDRQFVFGIAQGALHEESRELSLEKIQSMPFGGVAVGGLSVGESRAELYTMLDFLGPLLDAKRPRYLMGVGTIPDMLEAVRHGFDMFDCVLPTRNARNGQMLTSQGRMNIRNLKFADDFSAPDPECECRVCKRYSRSYIRHLFQTGEMLGPMLTTYHNLAFYKKFMAEMRASIINDHFDQFYTHWKKIAF